MNDYLLQQQQIALKKLENRHSESRAEKRKFIEKIITVTLTVLGFSLTIFSTDFFAKAFDNDFSLNLIFICWLGLLLAVVIGFIFLKLESDFNDGEALAGSLYANDNSDILDGNLNIVEGKDNDWIALIYLQGVRQSENDYWSVDAKKIFEEHKTNLDSWKLIKKPEIFYSFNHKRNLNFIENAFYVIVLISLSFMILGVGFALHSSVENYKVLECDIYSL